MKQREIKFRVFDRNSEMKYDVWPIGDTVYNPNGGFWLHNVQAVMQYTGLKDKNGKEIYEGDVLIYYDEYCVMDFRYGSFGVTTRDGSRIIYNSGWEIVGNIYQNPELLKP